MFGYLMRQKRAGDRHTHGTDPENEPGQVAILRKVHQPSVRSINLTLLGRHTIQETRSLCTMDRM